MNWRRGMFPDSVEDVSQLCICLFPLFVPCNVIVLTQIQGVEGQILAFYWKHIRCFAHPPQTYTDPPCPLTGAGLVVREQSIRRPLNQAASWHRVGAGCSVCSSPLGTCLTWESGHCRRLQETLGETAKVGKPSFISENEKEKLISCIVECSIAY